MSETKKGIRKGKNKKKIKKIPRSPWEDETTWSHHVSLWSRYLFLPAITIFQQNGCSLNMDSCKFLAPTMHYLL